MPERSPESSPTGGAPPPPCPPPRARRGEKRPPGPPAGPAALLGPPRGARRGKSRSPCHGSPLGCDILPGIPEEGGGTMTPVYRTINGDADLPLAPPFRSDRLLNQCFPLLADLRCL